MVRTIHHPRVGEFQLLAPPVHPQIRLERSIIPAPLLGEHTAEVYGRLLGLGETDLATLRRDGVL